MDTPDSGQYTDAPADVADVSNADTSVTSGRGADVGTRSELPGDPSRTDGLSVDLDDVDAVAAIPPGPGLSFRGAGADWWREGRTYVEPGWLRTSRDPQVGTDNFTTGSVVAVFGSTGRDVGRLSDHPEEQETVFLPGSRFTVLHRGEIEGYQVSIVKVHADGDDEATGADVGAGEAPDAVTRVTNLLASARSLPVQQVARPERFSGEFGRRR